MQCKTKSNIIFCKRLLNRDALIGHSANKVKNTEAKKLSKYHGSKRSKADIIPLFKERKRNPVRHGIDSWN